MVNYRCLSTNAFKVVALICASVCAWYMGYFFAEVLPEDSLQTAIGSMQKIHLKPVLKDLSSTVSARGPANGIPAIGATPPPKTQKCATWRTCSPSEVVYRIRSGAEKMIAPDICLEGEIIISGSKQNADRGINIAVVSYETMKVISTQTFDMYEGDFSRPMVDFINKIPSGSLILVASHDDAVTKLNEAAKKAFEGLGSKEVRNLKFRSQWVLLTAKGVQLPNDIEREKIIHSDRSNRYGGWPAEIQIDGCLPRKIT